jgi:axin 1
MEGDGRKRRPAGGGADEMSSTNNSKPWMKWGDSLQALLGDPTGSELFEQYLLQEGVSSQLDFIYAVDGLKSTVNEDDDVTLSQKIRSILHLLQLLIGLSPATREALNTYYEESTKHLIVDVTIFDNAIEEVESHMRANLYPNFLKSDVYINYIAEYFSTNTSASPLQTVREDIELNVKRQGLTRKALKTRNWWKDEHLLRNESISSIGSCGAANPYHASYSQYVPVSRQDSEIQSLSSGANTEHRFPVDGRGMHSMQDMSSSKGRQTSSKLKRHFGGSHEIAQSSGRRAEMSQPHTSRGESFETRPEKHLGRPVSSGSRVKQQLDPPLHEIQRRAQPFLNKGEEAELHPDRFARDLILRLNKLVEQDARGERFTRVTDSALHSESSSIPPQPGPPKHQTFKHEHLFEAILKIHQNPSERAEDILEEHCSRVFPDKTPDGRPSPPNRVNKSPPPFGKPKQSHGSRKSGHHVKKMEELDTNVFSSSRTPGYEEVEGGVGTTGLGMVPSIRHNRRQQRSDIIDSGISVLSSSVAALSVSSRSPGSGVPLPSDPNWKSGRGNGNGNGSTGKLIQAIIIYEDDPNDVVPYGLKVPARVTLGFLKDKIPKKGTFRYFFKRHSSSVEGSVIQEEITRDEQTLPVFEGKVVATLKST